MSLEGMDVEQARLLAQRLDQNARSLTHITAALGGLVAELGHCWRGSASAVFQQQWSTQYQAALTGAAHALSDMHGHLAANIAQQVQTSATDAGGGSSGGALVSGGVAAGVSLSAIGGAAGRVWDKVQTAGTWAGFGAAGLEGILSVTHDAQTLSYLKWLHDNPHMLQASHIIEDAHGVGILKAVDGAGTVLSVAGVGVDAAKGIYDFRTGNYAGAVGNFFTAGTDALKAPGLKDPLVYAAGVSLTMLHTSFDQIDWHQGIPSPLDPGAFQSIYVSEFKSLPGQMASLLFRSL